MLLFLIVLILFFGVGGGVYNGGAYRGYGFGFGGILLIVLLVLLLGGAYSHLGWGW
jgi:hypothetical protein